MQQLKVEQKNIENKDRRSGKGRCIALSRRIYRLLLQTENDVFYVESESTDGIYYYVKYNPDVKIEEFCSCKDNSTRHVTCKHLHAVTFAIRMGTVKDTDKLPPSAEAKRYPHETLVTTESTPTKKSFREDQYDF